MKKRHFFYFALLVLAAGWGLILPACKKDTPTTHIKGRVTEYGTGTPIKGARIYLLCDNSVVLGSSGSSLADSLVTDADGRFDRTYADAELCGSVFLLPYKEGYFKGNEIDLTTNFKELDVVLDPEAWLKVVTIPDLGQDHVSIGGTFSFTNSASDGTKKQIFLTRGNRFKNINWGSSPINIQQDSIFCIAHDTTIYTIHY